MSLSQALSIALTGLRANSQLIGVASNNIANAQTDGYTAKRANLQSITYGSQEGGVGIISYTRASDVATTSNYRLSVSDTSYYSALNDYLKQVQTNFDSTSSNPALSDSMSAFSSAWNNYISSPESSIYQNSLITAGRKLASTINDISNKTTILDRQVQQDLSASVTSLNSALRNVASLNLEIQQATTSGEPTGELEDNLDKAIREVSQYVKVNIQNRSNGQVALYTSSGTLLVDSAYSNSFSFDGTNVLDISSLPVSSSLTGGSIQAALDFRDTSTSAAASTTPGVGIIAKIRAQLSLVTDALTGSSGTVTSQFATAYASAVSASTASTGTQFGDTVASTFFTVTLGANGLPDPNTFTVNSTLINSTAALPQSNVAAIYNSFTSAQSYSTSGLTLTNATYTELTAGIITNMQQASSFIASEKGNASDLSDFYKTKLSNNTGVNLDQELASLQIYQNSYAASAKIVTTVNQMLQSIINLV